MGKRNTVNDTVFPNSSPAITRSKISTSTLSNLTHADSIQRSTLSSVTITRSNNPDAGPTAAKGSSDATTLRRCIISNSTLSHTSCRRGKVSESTLHNVRGARSLQATNSTLSNVASLRRVRVVNSTVTDQSAMARSEARDSVVTQSAVYRSSLEKSRVVKSRVKKSTLSDCEVNDCVILNTNFKGMVLKNGVWRNGKLVGSVGEGVVAVSRDGKVCLSPLPRGLKLMLILNSRWSYRRKAWSTQQFG
ncbi:hypothetical protein BJY01DRAFT_224739 [Aspergillus pseudoustus]|uniref:Uncharacterized protein n=1 Tax=Aspergillus pseudoustus TaxID=1810923 RepID=A0ABR4J233_9EURO